MTCDNCQAEIKYRDEHIKVHAERYCKDCYETYTTTEFFVDGEHLGSDEIVEFIGKEEWDEWDTNGRLINVK